MACRRHPEGQRWAVVMTTPGELGVKLQPRIEEIEDVRRELGEVALMLANADPAELPHAARVLLRASSDIFETAQKVAGVLL